MNWNEWIAFVQTLLGPQADSNTALAVLIGAAVAVVMLILCWIFGALGLSAMAKYRDINGTWMGWVPFASLVLLGRIADHYLLDVKNLPSEKRRSLPILAGALTVSVAVCVVFWAMLDPLTANNPAVLIGAVVVALCAVAVAVCFFVQMYTACYHIFYSCTPDDAKLLTVLCVILPVLPAFFLFVLRTKANGMPLRRMHI